MKEIFKNIIEENTSPRDVYNYFEDDLLLCMQKAYELGLKKYEWIKISDKKPSIGNIIEIWWDGLTFKNSSFQKGVGDIMFFGPEFKNKKLKFTHWRLLEGPDKR